MQVNLNIKFIFFVYIVSIHFLVWKLKMHHFQMLEFLTSFTFDFCHHSTCKNNNEVYLQLKFILRLKMLDRRRLTKSYCVVKESIIQLRLRKLSWRDEWKSPDRKKVLKVLEENESAKCISVACNYRLVTTINNIEVRLLAYNSCFSYLQNILTLSWWCWYL